MGLVWAQARGGVIGNDGSIPWHVPEDMAHFREVTAGARVIMGRRTWDSLPPRFRPLPGRENVVVTRQTGWSADGVVVVHALEDALAMPGDAPIWGIGGAEVYAGLIGNANRLEVTEIDAEVAGDTSAPEIPRDWRVVSTDPEHGWHESRSGLRYRWLRYER